MATNTYVALDTRTLVSNTATVTFSSISSAYTDLICILNVKSSDAGTDVDVTGTFNSDTGSNYSWTRIYGDGSTAGSQRASNQSNLRIGNQSGTGSSAFSPMILQIQNYSNTTTYKTMLARPNNPARIVDAYVNLWRSTSAISIISFSGNFLAGSTFSLYGVIAASATSPKATGGTIYEDSTYWYHAFGASGTFTPNQSLSCDYLVVAGGGGGGGGSRTGGLRAGGGGGAGGYKTSIGGSALSLTATAYSVTVGAGGSGGAVDTNGSSGSTSSFSTVSTTGGGGGGRAVAGVGLNGGSGGGGGAKVSPGNAGGTGVSGEGFAGGTSNENAGGGGGGATAVGASCVSSTGGIGGAGVLSSISGASTYYAGGGGGAGTGEANRGGAGGIGGGGQGALGPDSGQNTNAVSGTIGLGGGGGGGYDNGTTLLLSGNGGSGIVILRYLKA